METSTTQEIIDIANNTLKELYTQREIINGAIEKQTYIGDIYNQCQNIIKSMNDSFYRLFLFKNKKLPEKEKIIDKNDNESIHNFNNELELIKQINIEIGKELDLHNNKLNKALKFKQIP
jgi:hypothetical protein